MKKRNIYITGCVLALTMSSVVYAKQGVYLSGNLGVAMLSDSDLSDSTIPGMTISLESDPGFALGAAVGYDFGNNLRIEGEISYQQNDFDKASALGIDIDFSGESSALGFGVNGYYDFTNKSAFTPYITAGIGMAEVKFDDMTIPGDDTFSASDDDTVFAYQLGVGVSYAVTEMVNIDVAYRYRGFDDLEFDTTTAEYDSHNIYAGVRVTF